MMGDYSFRQAGGQGFADIFLFAVEQIGVRFIPASFRPAEPFAFCFQPCHRLPCSLADEVPLYLRREPERKSQHFALYIIPQAVAVFDRPHFASATHAEAQYLHDHVEVSAQPTQLATDDQISVLHMFDQFSQTSFGVRSRARDRFFYPPVYRYPLLCAEPVDLESLVLYRLLITTHADVPIRHSSIQYLWRCKFTTKNLNVQINCQNLCIMLA